MTKHQEDPVVRLWIAVFERAIRGALGSRTQGSSKNEEAECASWLKSAHGAEVAADIGLEIEWVLRTVGRAKVAIKKGQKGAASAGR